LSPVNAKRGRFTKEAQKDHESNLNDKNITIHIKKFRFVNLYVTIIKHKM
jgi:hypothetical protein